MKLLTLILFCTGLVLRAQVPAVFATGLLNPTKLLFTPGENLLVTEAGTTPNSGRISIVDTSGVRKTLISGLPSGLAAPAFDPDGPNGLVLQGNTLYILNGEGDGFRAGAAPNSLVPNPQAPSSPLLSSLMKLTLPASIDSVAGGFVMSPADHQLLADGGIATLTDSSGASATLELITDFRDGVKDPVTVWRNSHPYGMVALDSQPDKFYVVDAGMNVIYEVTGSTGRYRVLTRFAPLRNPAGVAGPPVSEAVPDSIRAYGNQLLVSFLRGFPFLPGGAQIAVVDPVSGATSPFIGSLSSAIDVLVVQGLGDRPLFYTLEYSANQGIGAPGQIRRYDTAEARVLADGLNAPTSIAYSAVSRSLYVALHNDGIILRFGGQ